MKTVPAMQNMKKTFTRSVAILAALAMVFILQGCKVPFKNKLIMIFEDGTRYFQKRESKNDKECRDWWTFAQSAVDKYKVKYDRFSKGEQEEVDASAQKLADEVKKCYDHHNAKVPNDIVIWFQSFHVDNIGKVEHGVQDALGDCTKGGGIQRFVDDAKINYMGIVKVVEDPDNKGKLGKVRGIKDPSGNVVDSVPAGGTDTSGYMLDIEIDGEGVQGQPTITLNRNKVCNQIPEAPGMPGQMPGPAAKKTDNLNSPKPTVPAAPVPPPTKQVATLEASSQLAGVHKHDASTSVLEEGELKAGGKKNLGAHSRSTGDDNLWVDDDMYVQMQGGNGKKHSHHTSAQELF